jgi:hypothetical protein
VGNAGTILKTQDGGANWVLENAGTGNGLTSVCFPQDAATGYVVGELGNIFKTQDGGATWFPQSFPDSLALYAVYFPVDASIGYAVGSGGAILKTTDGGSDLAGGPPVPGPAVAEIYYPVPPEPYPYIVSVPRPEPWPFTFYMGFYYDAWGRRVYFPRRPGWRRPFPGRFPHEGGRREHQGPPHRGGR